MDLSVYGPTDLSLAYRYYMNMTNMNFSVVLWNLIGETKGFGKIQCRSKVFHIKATTAGL